MRSSTRDGSVGQWDVLRHVRLVEHVDERIVHEGDAPVRVVDAHAQLAAPRAAHDVALHSPIKPTERH